MKIALRTESITFLSIISNYIQYILLFSLSKFVKLQEFNSSVDVVGVLCLTCSSFVVSYFIESCELCLVLLVAVKLIKLARL